MGCRQSAVTYRLGLDSAGAWWCAGWPGPTGRASSVPGGRRRRFRLSTTSASAVGDRAFRFVAAEAERGRRPGGAHAGVRACATATVTVGRHYAMAPRRAGRSRCGPRCTRDEETTLRDLEGLRLETTARDAWWHRGHDTGDEEGGPFTRRTATARRRPAGGASAARCCRRQEALPWFGLTAGDDHLVVGLAWSGGWRASLEGTAAGTQVQVGLRDMSVRRRTRSRGRVPACVRRRHRRDLRARSRRRSRRGWQRGATAAAFPALVTYNTWFTVRHLHRRPSWSGGRWTRSPTSAASSSSSTPAGIRRLNAQRSLRLQRRARLVAGRSRALPERPGRALAITRTARAASSRCGPSPNASTWPRSAAPARRASDTWRRSTASTSRDATTPRPPTRQVCLADEEAWQWVRERLFAFLDEARPDYLKIDFNGWLVCTRTDHDHTSRRRQLRPRAAGSTGCWRRCASAIRSCSIENCAGGARRLDAEMLTRTDVSWMDDRTVPAARVRHHLEVLSALVPPQALLSYLMGNEDESLDRRPGPAAARPEPDAWASSGWRSISGPSARTPRRRSRRRSTPTSRCGPCAARRSPRR